MPRRRAPRGTGSVGFDRSRGVWYARIYLPRTPDGKRASRKVHAPTRELAEQERLRLVAQYGVDGEDEPTARYRCYDSAGRLLYVGMSVKPEVRLAGHRLYAPWWPDMVRTVVDWYPDRLTAREAELRSMREESSVYNHEGLVTAPARMPRRGTGWALEAIRLRGQGVSMAAIARRVGASPARVRYALRIDEVTRGVIR